VTTLARGELVTAVELPRPPGPIGSVHVRRTRRRGHDLAAVTLACAIAADGVTKLAYGSLGPRPLLVTDETGLLADPTSTDRAKMERLETLFVAASPSVRSMRAGPEYRLAMLHVMGLRAVGIAIERLASAAVQR
jgi:CO/xanthine dehydrogenase FAD-binding subunit